MTKKRLSDLLRHEVEKSAEEEGADSQKQPAKPTTARGKTASKASEKAGDSKSATASQAQSATSDTDPKQHSTITELEAELAAAQQQEISSQQAIVNLKSDLQQKTNLSDQLTAKLEHLTGQVAQNAELQAELATARQHETALQQQIDQLKADLQQEIDQSDQLIAELDEVKQHVMQKETLLEQVTTELEEAKKVILQLSAANADPVTKTAPHRSQPPQKLMSAKPQRAYLKRLPDYCIQSEPKSTLLSDDDIGWVD